MALPGSIGSHVVAPPLRVASPRSWAPGRAARELGVVAAFSASILATNYALAGIPNVKLFDLLVFVAGYTLGFRRGAVVAVLSWLVYGTLNPWGPTTPALLVTVALSEMAYALAGVLCRRVLSPEKVRALPGRHTLLLGLAALASTLLYDVATNIYTGAAWAQFAASSNYVRWILIALFNPGALWFSALHVASNVLFFCSLAPPLIKAAGRAKDALRW